MIADEGSLQPISKLRGVSTLFICLFVLFAATIWLNLQLRQQASAWVEPPPERLIKLDPRIARILSTGHLPAVVDWLWMKGLQDDAVFHVTPGNHPPAYFDFDLATDLDPAFQEIYLAGGNLLAVIRDDKTGARDLLLKADRFFTENLSTYPKEFQDSYWGNSWGIYLTLAYVYLFELEDVPQAAVAVAKAAELPGSPEYLDQLANRLKTPHGQFEVALRILNFMIEKSNQQRPTERLVAKRQNVLVAKFLYELRADYQAYLNAMPQDRARTQVEYKKHWWRVFLGARGTGNTDPWGGRIYLTEEGSVETTTPREPAFGL